MTDTSMGSSRTITPSGGEEINQVAHKAFDEAQTNGAEPQEAFDAAAGAIREAGAEAGVSSEVVEEGIGAASEAFQQSMNEGGDPATAFDSAMEAGEAAGGDMAAPLRSEIVGRMVEGFDYVTAFEEEEEAGEEAVGDMPPPGFPDAETIGEWAADVQPTDQEHEMISPEAIAPGDDVSAAEAVKMQIGGEEAAEAMAEGGDPATAFDSAIQANEVPMPDSGAGDMLDAAISSVGSEPPTGESSEPRGADLALEQAVRRGEGNKTEKESETEDEDGTMDIDVEILEVLPADYADEAADS